MLSELILTTIVIGGNCFGNKNTTYENFEYDNNQIITNSFTDEFLEYLTDALLYLNALGDDLNDINIKETGLENYLEEEYSINSFSIVNNLSNSVVSQYGIKPIDINESETIFVDVNQELGREYLGCGPIAAISHLDFLAKGPKYYELVDGYNDYDELLDFYIEIASEIFAIPAEDSSITFQDGTFSLPISVEEGMRQIIKNHGLENQFSLSSDYIFPNVTSTVNIISKMKNSIDRGSPLILWEVTSILTGHFVNIYGYETFSCYDAFGNLTNKLFFKANCNPNYNDDECIYIDSEKLDDYLYCVIYVNEERQHLAIKPADYGYPCSYNNTYKTNYYSFSQFDIELETTRLRTGYVKHYDENGNFDEYRLVLSSKRQSYSQAYLAYQFNNGKILRNLSIDLARWGNAELFGNNNSTLIFYGFNSATNTWMNLYTYDPNDIPATYPVMRNFQVYLNESIDFTGFKIEINNSNSSVEERNFGRIILGSVHFYFKNVP